MITWVPFAAIEVRHLERVAESLLAAPADVRHSAADVMERLATGEWHLVEWENGLFIVHKEDNRLVIDATSCSVFQRKELAQALKRLAAGWLCDTIQTTVFDSRLADAIVNIGGQIESYDLVLRVGTSDEH